MTPTTADRVCETTATAGTGSFALAGAVAGYRTFLSAVGNGVACYYCGEAVDATGAPTGDWEVGTGTLSGGNTLSRSSVLASSNGGAAVNFAAGTKRVFAALPLELLTRFAVVDSANTFTADQTVAGTVTAGASGVAGSFAVKNAAGNTTGFLDGVLGTLAATFVTAWNAQSTATVVIDGTAGSVAAASFTGSGASLTSLPAGQLTGTVLDARLSSNVPLKNAANTFTAGPQTITVTSSTKNLVLNNDGTGRYLEFVRSGLTSYVAANNDLLNFRSLFVGMLPSDPPSANIIAVGGSNGQFQFYNSTGTGLQGLFGVATGAGGLCSSSAVGDLVFRCDSGGMWFSLGTTGLLQITSTTTKFLTSQLGFFSATPVSKPTVTGSRGANAALASLLTALANLGLLTDSTTA